eukprot:TRINITY_DN1960_c1_g1_i1.p1 TRINITY_DN1960_c1_g1~~TRINITY_DN1960_c1_g1_i1.p1  ORF type:complete len:594 (+),score=202.69 TRINITY_DN1960_c1_g1_i1:126-1784(+)
MVEPVSQLEAAAATEQQLQHQETEPQVQTAQPQVGANGANGTAKHVSPRLDSSAKHVPRPKRRVVLPDLPQGVDVTPLLDTMQGLDNRASSDGKPSTSTAVFSHARSLLALDKERKEISDTLMGEVPFMSSSVHRLCIDLLTNGHVNSFEDFFYLTHEHPRRRPATPSAAGGNGSSPRSPMPEHARSPELPPSPPQQLTAAYRENSAKEMTPEVLSYLKEHLAEAEHALRQGDTKAAIHAYTLLADHFEKRGDVRSTKIAIHFHHKCLYMAQQLGETTLEGTANRNLGHCYQQINDIEAATKHYERFSTLANEEGQKIANKNLVSAYKQYAQQCETSGDYVQAIDYYNKCLERAEFCLDTEAIGAANYHLGLCYKQINEAEKSIEHLERYLQVSKENKDELGEAAACSALAVAHQLTNDTRRAIKYLTDNLALAQRTNQLENQARACCSLGVIYNRTGDYARAAASFEQYFGLARQMQDMSMLEHSRVCLGVARGNLRALSFLGALASNEVVEAAPLEPGAKACTSEAVLAAAVGMLTSKLTATVTPSPSSV